MLMLSLMCQRADSTRRKSLCVTTIPLLFLLYPAIFVFPAVLITLTPFTIVLSRLAIYIIQLVLWFLLIYAIVMLIICMVILMLHSYLPVHVALLPSQLSYPHSSSYPFCYHFLVIMVLLMYRKGIV